MQKFLSVVAVSFSVVALGVSGLLYHESPAAAPADGSGLCQISQLAEASARCSN